MTPGAEVRRGNSRDQRTGPQAATESSAAKPRKASEVVQFPFASPHGVVSAMVHFLSVYDADGGVLYRACSNDEPFIAKLAALAKALGCTALKTYNAAKTEQLDIEDDLQAVAR